MAKPEHSSPLRGAIMYTLLMFGIIIARISPIETSPERLPTPDMMLVVTCLFVLRQPKWVPAWGIAVIFLLADFMTQSAPGLFSALVVIGTEILRRQSRQLRAGTRSAEWLSVAAVIAGITLTERVGMTLLFLPRPPLLPVMASLVLTILTYPVAGLLATGLGLRLRAPGSLDHRGQLA